MIGQAIWRFDHNRRVYKASPEGQRLYSESPIYREHWVPCAIVGENRISWLVGFKEDGNPHWKFPKKGPHPGFALTEEEVDADCWVKDHRYRVVRMVEHADADTLRKIAMLMGYSA